MDMIINKNSLGVLGLFWVWGFWWFFFLPLLVKLACRQRLAGEAGRVKAGTVQFSPPLPSLGGDWSWLGTCQGMLGVSEM